MKKRTLLAGLALAALALPASAVSLTLNFGDVSNPTFNQAGNLQTQFTAVSSGINASITAAAAFPSNNPANNGSVLGDLRVNVTNNNTVNLVVSLWDATAGSGFDTAYTNAGGYDWSFVFYDVDGSTAQPTFYDSVTIFSPGSFQVTPTTELVVTSVPGVSNTFSAVNVNRDIPGQTGLGAAAFTQEQADVAFKYTITDSSTMSFSYTVGNNPANANAQRNLLIDANDLLAFTPVPEASTSLIALLGASVLGLRRRRSA